MTSKDAPTQQQSQPNKKPLAVNLSTLPIPQLTSIKNQLTQELQHLTTSFTQLRTAQAKFRDCIKSVRDGIEKGGANKAEEGASSKPILVPLTPSLYVPGTLASTETVLVDIGTGFYVEKTPPAARQFYTAKVEELGKNLKDLETIVQGKQGNLTVVEDGMCGHLLYLRKGVVRELTEAGNSVTAEDDQRIDE
ncbi:MAG: hypothetical protein LQ349_006197 [Xanthoria aureola]|nr:MAG: hypothetical protein LQ349_006197 [Xanthoria aureola]